MAQLSWLSHFAHARHVRVVRKPKQREKRLKSHNDKLPSFSQQQQQHQPAESICFGAACCAGDISQIICMTKVVTSFPMLLVSHDNFFSFGNRSLSVWAFDPD